MTENDEIVRDITVVAYVKLFAYVKLLIVLRPLAYIKINVITSKREKRQPA